MSRARTLADLFNTDGNLNLSPVASINSEQVSGRRNVLINGAFQVAQRGTSTTGGGFLVDRFELNINNTDNIAITQSQDSSGPSGFANSWKILVTTAETAVAADERVRFRQNIEGQNLQQFAFGTSDAKSMTLSFYVKSNVTGTYAVNLEQDDASRIIGSTYTINSANTWERKTITVGGDTSGTINDDNGVGLIVSWYLVAGTNYTSTDNTSYGSSADGKQAFGHTADWGLDADDNLFITGVQLEVGATATDFEHRSFNEELYNCKRYFQKSFNYDTAPENGGATGISYNGGILGYCGSNNNGALSGFHRFDPEMRTTPTIVTYGNSSGHWGRVIPTNTGTTSFSAGSGYMSNTKASGINFGQNVSGDTLIIGFGHITASAEL